MFASDQAELYTVPDKQRQKKIQIQLHSPEETKKKKENLVCFKRLSTLISVALWNDAILYL